MVIYRIVCVTSSVFTTPSDDRATLVSRDYVQSWQILLNMDNTCYSLVAPSLWNLLAESIWSAETFATFKNFFLMTYVNCMYSTIHIPSTCSFVDDITNSCLLFFVDYSVMVSLCCRIFAESVPGETWIL